MSSESSGSLGKVLLTISELEESNLILWLLLTGFVSWKVSSIIAVANIIFNAFFLNYI